jgi:hypothetical protein
MNKLMIRLLLSLQQIDDDFIDESIYVDGEKQNRYDVEKKCVLMGNVIIMNYTK